MILSIPEEVKSVVEKLEGTGFEAYLVGGCVRDILLEREPRDWDVATNAKPEQVQKLFADSVYENAFGTVLVKTNSSPSKNNLAPSAKGGSSLGGKTYNLSPSSIEVTTYRKEGKYTDKRHPDEIKFAKTIEEDLSRRDFTVNAMALRVGIVSAEGGSASGGRDDKKAFQSAKRSIKRSDLSSEAIEHFELIDPFSGQADIKKKIIRTVGNPDERFNEDALRLLRAVRFATELDWEIEFNTRRAIEKHAGLLEMIAKERVRDEFVKLIMSDSAARGVILLEELNLLKNILPELREGIGCGQNKHHVYTVFEHNVRALDYTVKKKYPLAIRLASLLHDIGKPRSKAGDGPDSTFYNHEMIGAKMTLKIMDRLRFPKDLSEQVTHLVRQHLFYYNVGEVSAAGVRRFLARVGPENIDDLIKVREADRIGSGVPKAVPYKLRHLLFMIEKVRHDPLSPKMLKVNGEDVMKILATPPGPKVGQILNILLEEVLDDPKLNIREHLESEIKKLGVLSDKKLTEMMKQAKAKKNEAEKGIEEEIKKKYYVK